MRVLSVTHGPSVPGGVFDELVEEAAHELERWLVPAGWPPRPPARYDAVMVFGGSMHPDQDEHFPWLATEAEFLRTVLAEGVPVFGVCLGAQLLARAAGAWVGPARSPEIGWLEIELTDEGRSDPVLGTLPPRTVAFQWHRYTYALPAGAVELARSNACGQAFRLGTHAWGIQFHAEVTRSMAESWAAEDAHELPMGAARFMTETNRRIASWNEQGRRLCAAFLEAASSP